MEESRNNESPPDSPNPSPKAIEDIIWWRGELAAHHIVWCLQPTVGSEQRRTLILQYLQNLIRIEIGCEALPFGSFPLKSYLPDGDIDMTIICVPSCENAMASGTLALLEKEGKSEDSEFEVKEIEYIDAEVKLVKCVVQNIMVDFSFNQIGGLCTLCFFEQVDCFIGKDHLFKRSIMLIKAWCYYESRILGSRYGLISTYALETLVLYILNFFHSSLNGPLAVLYRFLDYYSKFDWEKYCISLEGPVLLSSLPELSVQTVANDGGDLLLTEEFLRNCVNCFSVPLKGSESKYRTFTKKHLNVIDPLRENNNLGRSVGQGNFYRIRSALIYGTRKLGKLLSQPVWSVGHEVNSFFKNTLEQNIGGERPDVQDWVPRSERVALPGLSGEKLMRPVEMREKMKADGLSSESLTSKAYESLNKEKRNIQISGSDEREGITAPQNTLSRKQQSSTSGEVDRIPSKHLTGDTEDLATSGTSVSKSTTESSKASSSTKKDSTMDLRNVYDQSRKDLELDQISSTKLGPSSDVPSASALSTHEGNFPSMQPNIYVADSSLGNVGWVGYFGAGYPSAPSYLANYGVEGNIGNRNNEPSSLNELSDLSGDYQMQLINLKYALWCHDYIIKISSLPIYQLPTYTDFTQSQGRWTQGSMFTGPISPSQLFHPTASYPVNSPKPRGLGTFFPKTHLVYRERRSQGRERNFVPENQPIRAQSNFQVDTPQDMSSVEKESHDPAIQTELVLTGSGHEKPPVQSDAPESSSQLACKPPPNAIPPLDYRKLFPGPPRSVSVEAPSREHGQRPDFPISGSQGSVVTSSASSSLRPALSPDEGRKSQSDKLKDEDFPPLSLSRKSKPRR